MRINKIGKHFGLKCELCEYYCRQEAETRNAGEFWLAVLWDPSLRGVQEPFRKQKEVIILWKGWLLGGEFLASVASIKHQTYCAVTHNGGNAVH